MELRTGKVYPALLHSEDGQWTVELFPAKRKMHQAMDERIDAALDADEDSFPGVPLRAKIINETTVAVELGERWLEIKATCLPN